MSYNKASKSWIPFNKGGYLVTFAYYTDAQSTQRTCKWLLEGIKDYKPPTSCKNSWKFKVI